MPRRPAEDVEDDLGRLTRFLSEPRTIEDMCNRLKCGERTVYRRLKDIEKNNINLVSPGFGRPTRYQILMVP